MTVEALKKVKTQLEENRNPPAVQPLSVVFSPGQTKMRPTSVTANKIYASAIKEQTTYQQFIKNNYMKPALHKTQALQQADLSLK
jgi:hypothetical protein